MKMTTTMTKRNTELMQDCRPAVEPALAQPRLLVGQFDTTGHQPRGLAFDFLNNFIPGPMVSPPPGGLFHPLGDKAGE